MPPRLTCLFFFFSSRRRHTRCLSDWSSDVCSSDLIVDTFTSGQASRLLPAISASGSLGAIAGPLVASLFVKSIGVPGLLLISAAGFLVVVLLVLGLIREKNKMQALRQETQASTMDHHLQGNLLDGFITIFKSPIL